MIRRGSRKSYRRVIPGVSITLIFGLAIIAATVALDAFANPNHVSLNASEAPARAGTKLEFDSSTAPPRPVPSPISSDPPPTASSDLGGGQARAGNGQSPPSGTMAYDTPAYRECLVYMRERTLSDNAKSEAVRNAQNAVEAFRAAHSITDISNDPALQSELDRLEQLSNDASVASADIMSFHYSSWGCGPSGFWTTPR